jgi:hypothetical protein
MESNHKIKAILFTRLSCILLVTLALFFYGCKVKFSFSGASTTGLHTVSIQYFQNRAPVVQPGLSQILTEALIDKCKAQTSLKYVTTTGDASFEGEISDYNSRPLTVGADAQAAENRFTIAVKVKFTNTVNPDLNFEQTFSRYKDFPSGQELSSVEKAYSDEIVDMLVEDIFNQAFVNW